ncbi:hypothetical protein ILUMI_02869 [Ignelater luminosus]|uniref:Uncharacterized protein n=1 Tax=Ignelater luminosus TaxID=2038154 RepID=A0A8K0DCN1_IGNLU|nr:hypothetical protein ILUMI_02869 [Ignelater luminosus]
MKPLKLKRHLSTKHSKEADKPLDFFERKLKTLNQQQTTMMQVSSINEKALLASYQVAKTGKSHTAAEKIIFTSSHGYGKIMLSKQKADTQKSIPLSDDTIKRRIDDMAVNIRKQINEKLKKSPHFALPFDESTDVTDCAHFLWYLCALKEMKAS